MSEIAQPLAKWATATIEIIGILIIVGLAVHSLAFAVFQRFSKNRGEIYQDLRQRVGRGILLGLEFLVAADIIRTVAVELTYKTVGTLAIIVLIRTFLSFTLEVELTGKWPWQSDQ